MRSHEEIDKKFLFQENLQLELQLRELQDVNKLHKAAIYNLSLPHTDGNKVISVLLKLLSAESNAKKEKSMKEQIVKLQSELMVLEKIVEQIDESQKDTYHILVEDFNKIREDNVKLEKELHKFYEKIGEVDYLSGLVTIHKEILNPSDQALSFKKEQEQLLEFISMQKEQINKLTEEKNKLLKINIRMKEEVEIRKDDVRNMTMILNSPELMMNISMQQGTDHRPLTENILDELEENGHDHESRENGNHLFNISSLNHTANLSFQNNSIMNTSTNKGLNTTLNNFMKMQNKIIKEEDEEQNGSDDDMEDYPELNILFPDKVDKIKKDKATMKIPYLNMKKIREMMAKREKKIRRQVEEDNKRVNPTDKIIKLETELEITRKELTNQSLKFRNMEEEFHRIKKICEQLENRNFLLMESNERLKANYQNVFKDYQFTKIVALRVQRVVGETFNREEFMSEVNTSKDYQEKLSKAETALRRIFGSQSMPKRTQSLNLKKSRQNFELELL